MKGHALFVAETAKYKEFQTVQQRVERNVYTSVMSGVSSLAENLPYGTPGDVFATMRHIFLLINLYQSCLPALLAETEELVLPFLEKWIETMSQEGRASAGEQGSLKHLLAQGSLFTRTGMNAFLWEDNYKVAAGMIRRLKARKDDLDDDCL